MIFRKLSMIFQELSDEIDYVFGGALTLVSVHDRLAGVRKNSPPPRKLIPEGMEAILPMFRAHDPDSRIKAADAVNMTKGSRTTSSSPWPVSDGVVHTSRRNDFEKMVCFLVGERTPRRCPRIIPGHAHAGRLDSPSVARKNLIARSHGEAHPSGRPYGQFRRPPRCARTPPNPNPRNVEQRFGPTAKRRNYSRASTKAFPALRRHCCARILTLADRRFQEAVERRGAHPIRRPWCGLGQGLQSGLKIMKRGQSPFWTRCWRAPNVHPQIKHSAASPEPSCAPIQVQRAAPPKPVETKTYTWRHEREPGNSGGPLLGIVFKEPGNARPGR